MICHSCGQEIKVVGGIGRRDSCPKCEADLHVCLNCNFYDETKSNDCAEPSAEFVQNKTASNFCEFFEPVIKKKGASGKCISKEEVLSAFDALFKKG